MIKFFSKRMNNKKGFTLIELIVVIAILGILAALAIPKLGKTKEYAEKNTKVANARTIASAVMMYQANNGADTKPTLTTENQLDDYLTNKAKFQTEGYDIIYKTSSSEIDYIKVPAVGTLNAWVPGTDELTTKN